MKPLTFLSQWSQHNGDKGYISLLVPIIDRLIYSVTVGTQVGFILRRTEAHRLRQGCKAVALFVFKNKRARRQKSCRWPVTYRFNPSGLACQRFPKDAYSIILPQYLWHNSKRSRTIE